MDSLSRLSQAVERYWVVVVCVVVLSSLWYIANQTGMSTDDYANKLTELWKAGFRGPYVSSGTLVGVGAYTSQNED